MNPISNHNKRSIDTVEIGDKDKVPFARIPLTEFDASNIVLNEKVRPSSDSSVVSNFSFAYYLINGKPHRFNVVVYGMKGKPIYDVSFLNVKRKEDASELRPDKRVVIEFDYYNDSIHQAIIDMLLSVYDRIIGIISRNTQFITLSLKPADYTDSMKELMKRSKSDPDFDKEEFWYNRLCRQYPEESFISKNIFASDEIEFDNSIVEQRRVDEHGNPVINDRPFSTFFEFRESYNKSEDGVKTLRPTLMDRDRKLFKFDDVAGYTAILGKMTLNVGMLNMMKGSIKVHRTISEGFLMNLEKRSAGMESYLDDIDPALLASASDLTKKDEVVVSEDEEEYDDMVELT